MSKTDKWDKFLQKLMRERVVPPVASQQEITQGGTVPIDIMTKEECETHPSSRSILSEIMAKEGLPPASEIDAMINKSKRQKSESLSDLLETLEVIRERLQPIFNRQLKVVFNDCSDDPVQWSAYFIVEREPGVRGFLRRLEGIPGSEVFSIVPGLIAQCRGEATVCCTLFDPRALSVVAEEIDKYAANWNASAVDLGLLYD